ncbi:insulin-like growth factor-binding protein complex acid labile subunit [Stegostoma tigrinum]|uniref:insulin-like growth factor-binding protein complex acid labile subunit n=1 Tax=Stegostoma tigrinum TaxID=3053191 RepID=UPI00202B5C6D|nr:insulin-like growth factor-binding protein complex acid labile subunit [Stegostoma tigrinum]XP_048416205.1 insulin-like growth factor-binding protein complex acid labile subunit [Stegostoma tigrinum]XP_048416206.1 insulin-like growth factor-binding protein complex acid labile subunit [Stegostoma tigrinum]
MHPVVISCLGMLMSVLKIDGFKACPQRCSCYDASHFVDCKGRSLSHIPRDIPHSTWMLDTGTNSLREIPSRAFHGLWGLRIILLPHNQIEHIHRGAFQSLSFLERLDLNQNHIQHLAADFSDGLQRLLELRLSNNWLEYIHYNSMKSFEHLEKLDLSGNRITSMATGVFRGLYKLRHLLLKNNRLHIIEVGYFFMLHSLEALHLENNNIASIEGEAFASLHSLILLCLNGNHLSHIKFKTFLNIQTQGTHLQLADNRWVCNCDLQREFGKISSIRHLHVDDYGNISCSEPGQLRGDLLMTVDSQLCIAETATVLMITGTVLVTVIAAIVMAERNRKKSSNKNWNDSEGPLDSQEK